MTSVQSWVTLLPVSHFTLPVYHIASGQSYFTHPFCFGLHCFLAVVWVTLLPGSALGYTVICCSGLITQCFQAVVWVTLLPGSGFGYTASWQWFVFHCFLAVAWATSVLSGSHLGYIVLLDSGLGCFVLPCSGMGYCASRQQFTIHCASRQWFKLHCGSSRLH